MARHYRLMDFFRRHRVSMTTRQRMSGLKQTHAREGADPGRETAATVDFPFPVIKDKADFWLGLGRLLVPGLLLVMDYIAVVLALATAYQFRLRVLPLFVDDLPVFTFSRSYEFFILPFIYLTLIFYERLYQKRLPFWQSAERLFKACLAATVIAVGIMYFTYTAHSISRTFVAVSGALTFINLAVLRYLTKGLLVKSGLWQKPVIVVGQGRAVNLLTQAFAAEPNMGYRIVGLVGEATGVDASAYPVLGDLALAEDVIKASGVKDVIIAAPELGREQLLKLLYRIRPLVDHISIVPDLFGMPLSNLELETLFDQQTIVLRTRNNLASRSNRFFKYALDITCCLGGLLVFLPVFFILVLVIYIDSPGPVVFAHRRLGVSGKSFNCLKFRTMVTDAQSKLEEYLAANPTAREEWQRDFKLKDDPRITRVGKWLRKTSLDELPQIFNILRGEMSLVGPRPIVTQEVAKYGELINDYYMVRPGLTGYWQVNGRNDVAYETRVMMDSWYVRNWAVWLDITLLMKTVGVVLGRKGAY